MAHKKGVGSTDNGRDSNSKRLGVKLFGGQFAKSGNIIVRQRGTKFHPGLNVGIGKDHTLFALSEGTISFQKRRKNRTFVNVIKETDAQATILKPAAKPKVEAAPKTVKEKSILPQESVPQVKSKPAVAKQVKSKPAAAKTKTPKADNLKKIEGIGPKTSELLIQAGITSFAELAATEVVRIQEILDAAGSRYKIINPGTWPEQAAFAAEGKWDELKELQGKLDGGKA